MKTAESSEPVGDNEFFCGICKEVFGWYDECAFLKEEEMLLLLTCKSCLSKSGGTPQVNGKRHNLQDGLHN